jgi:YVTN family beta-propeller protein
MPGQVVRGGLPISHKSLSARSNANGPLQLDVEDAWRGAAQIPQANSGCAVFDVEIEFLDSGSDTFLLRYARMDGTETSASVRKTGTSQWRSTTLRLNDAYLNDGLPSGADLELFNPDGIADVFHRVRVEMLRDCAATATPTSTPSRTPTPTATPTPTWTSTPTSTPSPTVTPTPTSLTACLPAPAGTIMMPDDDQPKGMATDGDLVYVALFNQPQLAIIDGSSDTLQGVEALAPGGVNGVAVVSNRVYTSNRNSAQLSISQAGSGALMATVGVGGLPWGVGGVNDRVYVANFADGTVMTLSTIRGAVIRTTAVGPMPAFIAALPNKVYVTHITGRLSVLSHNGSLLANFAPGSAGQLWGLALNPSGELLYLADRPNNRILVLSTATNQVVNTIALPGPPTALALNPSTGHLFAVDAASDRVLVVDIASNSYLGAVPVGPQDANEGGQGIAVARNKVYVANWLGRSVSVLNDTTCSGQITPLPPTPTPTPPPR